jgi:hypothetical protein
MKTIDLALLREAFERTDAEWLATRCGFAAAERNRAYLEYHAALVSVGGARAIPCGDCYGEGGCAEDCIDGAWPCTWCGERPAVTLSTHDRDPRCRACHEAWCEGCDETYDEHPKDVRDYLVTDHGGRTERVRYCLDCADLAAVDWNGETRAIVPAAA